MLTRNHEAHHGKKRALTLAGGGPAVGIGLGVLEALERFPQINFDVWSLSCVGAWLGCLYHVSPDRAQKLQYVSNLMQGFFRDDKVYDKFPCPTVFVPDIPEVISAYFRFMIDPTSYTNLVVPSEIKKGYQDILDYYLRPSRWSYGDFCHLMLNSVLAPNPAARFLMSMIYKSEVPGQNKLWFGPSYNLLKDFDMALLDRADVPTLYHNAFNVDAQKLQLFSNKDAKYPKISAQTLCACSGLPYILSPVNIDGTTYVEGATVDTVGFWDLLQNHPDLDEIWVCRILDTHQIHPHHNLVEALNNLVMLFASTTSEDDVKLFKFHLQDINRNRARTKGTNHELGQIDLIEFPVDHHTSYEWTHSNLRASAKASCATATKTIEQYLAHGAKGVNGGRLLEPNLE
ncbi:MAG TPA: patatin-like phospholipase family protein [Xanthobacteraceae bacterium]|nr:patatin-like phospholipase family protein [Xanthobacteraceae bacterium]